MKHAPGDGLADDGHGFGLFAVPLIEIAARDERHAERGKEARRNDAELAVRIVLLRRPGVTLDR